MFIIHSFISVESNICKTKQKNLYICCIRNNEWYTEYIVLSTCFINFTSKASSRAGNLLIAFLSESLVFCEKMSE